MASSTELIELMAQRRQEDALKDAEQQILRAIVESRPLGDILDLACRTLESVLSGALCSVLLLSPDGKHLLHGAAPSLPKAYSAAIDGAPIGPAVGSCGTAAYRNEMVIVEDIETDPLWADYKELAAAHGLRACWSIPLKSKGGTVLGTFATYHRMPYRPNQRELDIAWRLAASAAVAIQRKQLDEALIAEKEKAETASRAKSEFLANMSHELRTPLNAVIGFSDVLAQQLLGPVPESYNESIEAIRTSGRHLLEIISDLLEMSRIESGERYLQEAPFDVRAAILACSQNFSNQAKRDGIALLIDNTGRLPTLLGEERAFKQILGNLLSNALKFTPRNGQVTITATTESDTGLLIAVSDTGKGIDPLLLPKLGKPFAQGESSLSRRYGGVGLGLAISRRLMDLHNGRLEITSAPDAVTRVIMIFPPERILSENTR